MRLRQWLLVISSFMIIVFWGLFQQNSFDVLAQTNPTATIFRPTVAETGLPPVLSATPTPTRTFTPFPTLTPTNTATPTNTKTNTPTSTNTPTNTTTFTLTSTGTSTLTVTPSRTASPSDTRTGTRTETPTATPTQTRTETVTRTNTLTATETETLTATASATPTDTHTPSDTPTQTSTTTRVPSVIESTRPEDDARPNEDGNGGIPLWAIVVGGVVTLLGGGYMLVHAWSAASLERYEDGFFLDQCPICEEGHLVLEERPYSAFGIPRVRRAVRCDNCRSVLREVRRYQWRYAVDPSASRDLYAMLNNKVIPEQKLAELSQSYGETTPEYVDEE